MRRASSSLGFVVPALVALATAVAWAGPNSPTDLQGRWQFSRMGHNGAYVGTLVIDQRGQARLKGKSPTQSYSECGFLQVSGDKVEIVFTSAQGELGYSPDHFYCMVTAGQSLTCSNVDAAGRGNATVFTMARVGDVPASAADRLDDVCQATPTPRS